MNGTSFSDDTIRRVLHPKPHIYRRGAWQFLRNRSITQYEFRALVEFVTYLNRYELQRIDDSQ